MIMFSISSCCYPTSTARNRRDMFGTDIWLRSVETLDLSSHSLISVCSTVVRHHFIVYVDDGIFVGPDDNEITSH
jgi:hypothetical protein